MLDELGFEKKLIQQLTLGESQWTLREDIKTEEALWNNIRNHINRLNTDKLKGENLTNQEFNRIKEQMNFASFYQAGEWLKGENGVVRVEIQRGSQRLRLEVLNQNEIAGGLTSYEVIHQLSINKREQQYQDRRLDVTLLMNGLPLIHIELKGPRVQRKEAFNQINKYIKEGIFRGPLSMVQMFVVMNEGGAQYIAAPRQGSPLNSKFLTNWLDEENQPIYGGLNFAKEVLSIPQAHHMISDYMVLDAAREALILLRPYQIQAIQKISQFSKEGLSGFVWHTTGSGKTLTSYKVARNLLKIPSVDKTIFLVDRRDLDDQTFTAFDAYSANDPITVEATNHTQQLMGQLLSDNRHVIVTTRQKFDNIIRRAEEGKISEGHMVRLRQLRLAFVVDECHRTISSEKQRILEHFFPRSMWYGFTGTPIFSENSKHVKGDLAATTEGQYGPCLHRYTVKEAIHDKSVLGFKVEYQTTIDDDEVYTIVENAGIDVSNASMAEVESYIPKEYYDHDAHRLEVIDAIVNRSRTKLGMSHQSKKKNGEFYEAILTVPSIREAQRYYELFQEVVNGNSTVEISKETQRYSPDFPKVAITYSVSENEDDSIQNQEKMRQAIDNYNQMFGTHFSLENMNAYNCNLNARLAQKESRYQKREEQLDLVIVVDRLLTGFDAPCISTLFIDRAPQKPQDLIQAFSRTNRIFDENKRFGNITTFRTPHLFKECVDEALRLYSCGGQGCVLAPSWEETEKAFKSVVQQMQSYLSQPNRIYQLSKEGQKEFMEKFRALNSTYCDLIVYEEYGAYRLEDYGLTLEQLDELQIIYTNLLEELREDKSDDETELIEIDYQWKPGSEDTISYDYIVNLMQQMVKTNDQLQLIDEKTKQEVENFIQQLSKEKPDLAYYIKEIWQNILADPYQYEGQDIHRLLEEKINEKECEYIRQFADRWYVQEEDVRYAVQDYDSENERDSADLTELAKKAVKNYREHETESTETTLKLKIRMKKEFKQLMAECIDKLY